MSQESNTESGTDIRSQLVALEPLDLKQCRTVGELVRAMSKCSFGARMLGEVAETLLGWIRNKIPTVVVFCGPDRFESCTSLYQKGWIHTTPNTGPGNPCVGHKFLVIGRFSENEGRWFPRVFLPEDTIFINHEGLCLPGQVRDGYFPNVVFEDPRLVVPVIAAALDEWLGIKTWTVTELFKTLSQYGGLAAEVVRGAQVLKAMIDDPDCTVFMTASGAMTVANLDYLLCDMINEKMIQCLTTTGALMAHGFVKGLGLRQYKYDPRFSDEVLALQKLNRVTDTIEPEENFEHVDEIMNEVLDDVKTEKGPVPPGALNLMIGLHLARRFPNQRGILKSAALQAVPVCVPAFVDSELGNDVFCHNAIRARDGRSKVTVDPEGDSKTLMDLALASEKMGIFSIGGGVPRNNVQNVAPLIEIFKERLRRSDLPDRHFSYGCRICPDPMWYGHLSGCTYSENESWRKMRGANDARRFAQVHADATIALPLILKWVMENR